jgi:hypothetical protein
VLVLGIAAAVSIVALAIVMLVAAIDRETPYRVIAKPLESRIHLGKDNDVSPPPAVRAAHPARRATSQNP